MKRLRWTTADLRTRARTLYLVAVVVAVVGVALSAIAFNGLVNARVRLTERLSPATIAVDRWLLSLNDQERGLESFVLTGDDEVLEPYREGLAGAEASEAEAREALSTKPELLVVLDEVAADIDEWHTEVVDPLIAQTRAGGDPAGELERLERANEVFDEIRGRFSELQDRLQARRAVARQDLTYNTRVLAASTLSTAMLFSLSLAATWLALNRWVVDPLDQLRSGARQVADGDLRRPIAAVGPPDLQSMARDMEAMRQRIVDELALVELAVVRLEEQAADLSRSNQELEQFAYVASHDLQEPLRKITGFCQLLQRRYQGQLDERADEYITYAVDGAKRMQLLINDLLTFSRVGRTTEALKPVDLARTAAKAVDTLTDRITESGGTVEVGDLPTVAGDPMLLESLFQNLVGNALKFHGDDPPRVVLDAVPDDDFWRLSCTDNGIGIEPQYAERVFAVFQRLHNRESYSGTGIGLAMCRKVVEFHGGRIWLDTDHPGPGTSIVWTLPSAPAPDPETSADAAVDRAARIPSLGDGKIRKDVVGH